MAVLPWGGARHGGLAAHQELGTPHGNTGPVTVCILDTIPGTQHGNAFYNGTHTRVRVKFSRRFPTAKKRMQDELSALSVRALALAHTDSEIPGDSVTSFYEVGLELGLYARGDVVPYV